MYLGSIREKWQIFHWPSTYINPPPLFRLAIGCEQKKSDTRYQHSRSWWPKILTFYFKMGPRPCLTSVQSKIFFPPSKKAAKTNMPNLRVWHHISQTKLVYGSFFQPLYQHMGEVIIIQPGQFEWWACMQPDHDPPPPPPPQKKNPHHDATTVYPTLLGQKFSIFSVCIDIDIIK